MQQSNYIEISRNALFRNAAAVADAVQVPVIGVVKCNGYGVTIAEAAAAWKAAGAAMFAVSRPEEAVSLRRLGYAEDILLLSPVADCHTLAEMARNNIILTISSFDNAQFYSLYAFGVPLRVHIAVDTGMGRFGIRWTDMAQIQAVYTLVGLSFEGIFSHFSNSFAADPKPTMQQLNRFLQVTDALQNAGLPVGIRHIANSNAALRFPETRLDAVRIGSALVGICCPQAPITLEPVRTFYATVVDCKYLNPGDTTGYGSLFTVKKYTKAAVVALGRIDGFGQTTIAEHLRFRNLASYLLHALRDYRHPPCVVYQGQALPLLGRVGNSHTLFDATGTDICPGDRVQWQGSLLTSRSERHFY